MDLNESQYAALKTELTNDPLGLGYVRKTDEECADLLNEVAPDNKNPEKRVLRDTVESWEIVGATVYGEYVSLTATQRDLYGSIVSCGKVNPQNGNIRTIFGQLFGVGTTTRAQLNDLQYRGSSRAEKLFGSGAVAKYWDVNRARAL